MPDDPTPDEVERYFTNRESLSPERLEVLQRYAQALSPHSERYYQKFRASQAETDRLISEAIHAKSPT